MSTLTIQLPGLPAVSHVLRGDTITIGRMEGNAIVIDDTSVSLLHAKITLKDGEFYLKDLNSTNGTSLNGQPIKEAKLRDLDKVRFAEIACQFHAEAVVASAPTVISKPASNAPAMTAPAAKPAAGQPAAAAQPINQPAKNPLSLGQTAKPKQAAAPAAKSPAPASAAAPSAAPRRPQLIKLPDRKSLLLTIAPYGGAVIAVIVISLVVWKLSRPSIDKTAVEPIVNVTPKKAITNAPAKVAVAPPKVAPIPAPKVAVNPVPTPPPTETQNDRIPELIKALKSQDTEERRRAANDLHSLGTEAKAAIPQLREALKDSDADVQMFAALTLINNESYDKATLPILIHTLQNENALFRQVACLSLGVFPFDKEEQEIVAEALTETATKDSDEDVRQAAVSALKIISPVAAVKTQ